MRRTKKRLFPVPANYPIAADKIPDMPISVFHLYNTGHWMASEAIEFGEQPMRCAKCQEHPLDLIFLHDSIPLDGFSQKRGTLPGMVWGKDVSPICPGCSFGLQQAFAKAVSE